VECRVQKKVSYTITNIMLNPSEEREAEVTWEDQQNINTFGRLNARLHECEAEIKAKEDEITNLQDASNEIILADDDEGVRYHLGEVFIEVSKDELEIHLEQQETKLKADIDNTTQEIAAIRKTLAELKVKLYTKFSTSINLEED